jgi:hypothetical protein
VGRDVRVVQPGEIRPIAHGENLRQETVQGMNTHLSLHGLTIKDHLVTHLVAGRALSFLADYRGDDGEPVGPGLAFFGHGYLLSVLAENNKNKKEMGRFYFLDKKG